MSHEFEVQDHENNRDENSNQQSEDNTLFVHSAAGSATSRKEGEGCVLSDHALHGASCASN